MQRGLKMSAQPWKNPGGNSPQFFGRNIDSEIQEIPGNLSRNCPKNNFPKMPKIRREFFRADL
jgi:hypothetical protein